MRVKGQVTVFLSLIIMCVFTLICGLLESARTAGARWYLQMAVSSSLDSVFSQYHRPLWDSYRLLFAEYEDEEELEADFSRFLLPYLETENWYPMELSEAVTEEFLTAVDDNGTYLEQEILDYMKYGIWEMDFDAGTVEELWTGVREAAAVKDVAADYRGNAKEALKLEKALEAVSECLRKQEELRKEGLSKLRAYDGPGFRRRAEQLVRELERVPGLVEAYRRKADALAKSLEKSREAFRGRQEEIGDSAQELLEQEIRQYESYVAVDGQRRLEVEALAAQSDQQAELVRTVIEEAREVERVIDEWDDDDEDDDGPDLAALWSPVIRRFSQISIHTLSFSHGVKDKEKEGYLNRISQMCGKGLLGLVIPEGTKVSAGSVDLAEAPSTTEIWSEGARMTSLADHLLVNEYCGKFFRYFGSDHEEPSEGPAYELEYLIEGKSIEEDNLSGAVTRLLAVREGLNLLHILSDSQKRAEARNLALAITGVAGVTPLVFLTAFMIMSMWALGEAVVDIRGLLAGNKVMLIKAREDWTLDLDGLLTMGRQGELQTGKGSRGLDYRAWLKILLIMEDLVCQEYRMMDLIQTNIRKKQDSFRMRRGMYQTKLLSRISGKHVFFSLGFMDKSGGGQEHRYQMEAEAERAY